MKVDLAQFKKALGKQAQRTMETIVKDTQLAVGRHVYEKMILRTPVLTGHARHNWRPSINEQVDAEEDGVFGGQLTGDPITGDERARWSQVSRQLGAMPLGQTIWICNNVPYAQALEHGWSGKAPSGMVEITLREVLEGVHQNQPRMMANDSGS